MTDSHKPSGVNPAESALVTCNACGEYVEVVVRPGTEYPVVVHLSNGSHLCQWPGTPIIGLEHRHG